MTDKTVTVECYASDPLDVRAENIVKFIGFTGDSRGWSAPQISPTDATLRVIRILRKYQELDKERILRGLGP